MFRINLKNKKGQNTAEYALLIALVVAGIIAMQQYAQRALQARVRGAAVFMQTNTATLGTTVQYEPYYQQSDYTVTRNSEENKHLDNTDSGVTMNSTSNRTRSGKQTTAYDATTLGAEKPKAGAMPSGI